MAITFTKVIFGVILFGIIMTGFVNLGQEISGNTNLDPQTTEYLNSLESSTQDIQDLSINETDVSVGTEDSFAKQYIESKLFAQRSSQMLSVVGDIPTILIQSLGIDTGESQWLINYIFLAVGILSFAVVMYMLFGRKW